MNKVYLVQEVFRRDETTGQLVPALDLSDAARYGAMEVLLQPGRVALSTAPMMARLRTMLRDFCDEDYLLPTGDTVAIAAASMVAASFNRGRVKVLSWDRGPIIDRQTMKRGPGQYIPIQLSLNGE